MSRTLNLLDVMQLKAAEFMDGINDLAAFYGLDSRVSVVISKPDTADDSFVVGQHETDELFAILKRLETGDRVERDITSTSIGPDERFSSAGVQ